MRERRRSPRFDLVLPVVVNTAHGVFRTKTVNASSLGVVVFADQPPSLGSYAELEVALPDGRIVSATAVVTRLVKELADNSGGKGRGVAFDFYLFDARGQETWNALIDRVSRNAALKQAVQEESTDHSVRVGPAKTSGAPEISVRRSRDALPPAPAPVSAPAPVIAPPRSSAPAPRPSLSDADDLPTFLIKPRDVDRLRAFMRSELSSGRVRIETPVLKPVGTKVELVVVHPSTNAEWTMPGEVTLASETGRGRGPMLEIAVLGLTEEEHNRFRAFVQHGRSVTHDRVPSWSGSARSSAPPPPVRASAPAPARRVSVPSVPPASVPPPVPPVSPLIAPPSEEPAFLMPEGQLPTEIVAAYQPSVPPRPEEEITADEMEEGAQASDEAPPERVTEPPDVVPLPGSVLVREPAVQNLSPSEVFDDSAESTLVPGGGLTSEPAEASEVASHSEPAAAAAEGHRVEPVRASEPAPAASEPARDSEPVRPSEPVRASEPAPVIHDSERARRRERVRSKPFASFFHEFMPGSLPPDSSSVTAQAAGEPPTSFEDGEETRRDFRSESSVREYAPIVLDQDIEAAKEKVDKAPESATAIFQLGRLLYRKGDPAAALDVLSKAVELEPNHPGAHHAAAQALVELGRYDIAAEHLRKARLLGYQIDAQLEREINQRR